MHLYLDTANQAAAESPLTTGLFAGLTTNPTILQRASQGVADIPQIYRWATAAGAREVFFQAWARTRPRWSSGDDGSGSSATRWSSSSSPHAPARRPAPPSPPSGSRPC